MEGTTPCDKENLREPMLGLYCAMLEKSQNDLELKSMITQIHADQTDDDELNDWFPEKYPLQTCPPENRVLDSTGSTRYNGTAVGGF